jgi:hypothetical protein
VNDQRCQTKQNIKIQEYIPDGSPFNDHFPEFSDKSVDSSYCPLVRDLKKKTVYTWSDEVSPQDTEGGLYRRK